MRIVFIGCVTFSHRIFKHLLTSTNAEVVGLVTKRSSPNNSDFYNLQSEASAHGIPSIYADEQEIDIEGWIQSRKPDVIYCIGWSHLLKANILNIPPLGVVGYHPAALPRNRGRHPIIWALALGLKNTASTFFVMDEGADSGDIISQHVIAIEDSDDASSLYSKLETSALQQITEITDRMSNGMIERVKQDHSQANYWRKRSKQDGKIDWRMSANSIHNLVRALSYPYPGAHCEYKGEEIKIWKTKVVDMDFLNYEPGKVIHSLKGSIIVKCGEGAIELVKHEFSVIPSGGIYL